MSNQNFKLENLMEYFNKNGFSYSEEQVYNLIISLKTKPFTIISGISGTGKSRIIELLAEYMQDFYNYKDNYEVMAVKPNWTDSRGVFGYQNILDETYSITQTIEIFLRAKTNPNKPYFLVLDEMNLARVEHYFSDFLSLIESRKYRYKYTSIDNQATLTDEFNEELKNQFNRNIKLSEAIILAALQDKTKEFNNVEHYRTNPISEWWFEEYSDSSNLTPQFRSELNQGRSRVSGGQLKTDGSRLAGKCFWCEDTGNSYKLKDEAEMDEQTLENFLTIKEFFNNAKENVIQSHKVTVQEKVKLHNSIEVLKTSVHQNEYSDSSLTEINNFYSEEEGYYVPSKIEIPLNVFVIGTVNVDETTYSFSPKVLDRSNVIEFNEIDLYHAYEYGEAPTDEKGDYKNQDNLNFDMILPTSDDSKVVLKKYEDIFNIVIDIFKILEVQNMHFGYRVINEISRYILNFNGEDAPHSDVIVSLDYQVSQKILPKMNGSVDELDEVLKEIFLICKNNNLPRSANKLEYMINELESQGFTTFLK